MEVLLWMRGAYRSLSLGRKFVETGWPNSEPLPLNEWIERELLKLPSYENGVSLVARYPASALSGLERLQETLWSSFFYDYEFRRWRPDTPSEAASTAEEKLFVVLKRPITAKPQTVAQN